jgi:hypothetical protein
MFDDTVSTTSAAFDPVAVSETSHSKTQKLGKFRYLCVTELARLAWEWQ